MMDKHQAAKVEDQEKNTTGVAIPIEQALSLDNDALKVINRLRRFGHSAYLVGGCVRDMLLGLTPKDFDVATSASPREIRKLFRNCQLIGRRFRLAHIHFRGKIIETATFRAEAGEQNDGDLLIRSDNVYGTEEEDACRRDFTINAMFFDTENNTVIDYVGGMEDLEKRKIRFIGSPSIRVREDPVRIIRAIKFAARLGFDIDQQTWQAMVRYQRHLTKCARPRILEEIHRMLRGGSAEACFRLMWESGVLNTILPEVAVYLRRSPDRGEERDPGAGLWTYLRAVDQGDRDLLTNAVLVAAMMMHPVIDCCNHPEDDFGLELNSRAPGEVARKMMGKMIERLNVPRREAERVQQLVASQKKLFNLSKKSSVPKGLFKRNYFPEALDLFEIGVRATRSRRWMLNRLRHLSRQLSNIRQPTIRLRKPRKKDRKSAPPKKRPMSKQGQKN
jgi:poly(A) polymerase